MYEHDNRARRIEAGGAGGYTPFGPSGIPQDSNSMRPPAEPGLVTRAAELLKHTAELDAELCALRGALFPMSAEVNGNVPAPDANSLEEKIALACQRVACMVGQLRTMNAKLK